MQICDEDNKINNTEAIIGICTVTIVNIMPKEARRQIKGLINFADCGHDGMRQSFGVLL
jgi:hypothetical protein